ncbi:NAD(P)/FAD-dependent oxidoreductase [Homoserinimonas sp. A447]
MTSTTHHDVIIIGAGAAGLSAGLVLARAQAQVLVIDAGEPRNAPASHMHGFLSRDGMSPAELLAVGRREVTGYGGVIASATVSAVKRRADDRFEVTLDSGEVEVARALLVATGLRDELPDLPGIRERWGSQVHHCPYCHGFEVSGQAIVVIGGPAPALSLKQAGLLLRYSDRVTFVTNGIMLTPPDRHRLEAFGARVIDGTASGFVGKDGSLAGVALTDGSTVACEAVFVAPRPHPADGILHSLGCETDPATGFIAVDAAGQTSVPGIWAAGNVVNANAQVITAAGAGSSSAMAINGWLLQLDMDAASTDHSPE